MTRDTAQQTWIAAGELNASHIGKGIWTRIRYRPEEQWESRYEWDWARITMITHTSKGGVKVRIRGGGLVDATYAAGDRINITTEEHR